MIRRVFSFLSFFLFFALFSHAFEYHPGTERRKKEGVSIHETATATLGNETFSLRHLGSGLRKKYIGGLIGIDVYVAQLLGTHDFSVIRDENKTLLREIEIPENSAFMVRMHFLYDVSVGKLVKSYKGALSKNGVDLKSPPVKAFLETVDLAGGVKSGQETVVAIYRTGGVDRVAYQGSDGKTTFFDSQGSETFVRDLLSIWLGIPTDKGLRSLRKQILGGA